MYTNRLVINNSDEQMNSKNKKNNKKNIKNDQQK